MTVTTRAMSVRDGAMNVPKTAPPTTATAATRAAEATTAASSSARATRLRLGSAMMRQSADAIRTRCAAIQAGARGYALKSEQVDQIRSAIKEVAAGRDWISPRLAYIFATDDTVSRPTLSHQESRALQLYATGLPMKSVAKKMAISEETVKQYLSRVRQKYIVAGRAAPTKLELYHRAVEDGHLPPTP